MNFYNLALLLEQTVEQMRPFLLAIAANVKDDGPKLIFADYLEEKGNILGEIIRIKVALSHNFPDERLQNRYQELHGKYLNFINQSPYEILVAFTLMKSGEKLSLDIFKSHDVYGIDKNNNFYYCENYTQITNLGMKPIKLEDLSNNILITILEYSLGGYW